LLPFPAALNKIIVNLLLAISGIHPQDRHAILENGIIEKAQVGEVEWKSISVVETSQESGDNSALPRITLSNQVKSLQGLDGRSVGGAIFHNASSGLVD
jgi:hypothetical protein